MQQLYLIGKGIAHSASPAMYNALYEQLGLDWHYDLADLAHEEEARALLAAETWLSVNVTTPYKPLAFEAATIKAASVQLSGGSNMLFRKGDAVVALNTDGLGCVRYIQREGYVFKDANVVVCGTGPTARAILAAVAQAGARRVALIGRDRDRAKSTLDSFLACYKELAYATMELEPACKDDRTFRAAYAEPSYVLGSYTTSTEELAAADIIIDATPLGMNEGDSLPFAPDVLGGQQLVFDVVYGHGESKLLTAAKAAGVQVLDGHGMVVAQAVENAMVLLESQAVQADLSWDDMFSLMYAAAFPR